jgi:RimJ/RimL family protein N-acetyltransferase
MIWLKCTKDDFQPANCDHVRWLDWDPDFELASSMWPVDCPLTREVWIQARADGYRYCGAFVGKTIISIGAEYRYSEPAWMVAAVRTATAFRRKGHAKGVVSFVTAHILDAGRVATCCTAENNAAMIRTAESVGFRKGTVALPATLPPDDQACTGRLA